MGRVEGEERSASILVLKWREGSVPGERRGLGKGMEAGLYGGVGPRG